MIDQRFNSLTLPTAEIIDLKDEIKKENFSPISERMQGAIGNVLKKKEQAILFLNRRGMSTFVSCRDCGYVVNCSRCEIPMIQHLATGGSYLLCHHCGKKMIVPKKCPDCGGFRIKYFGTGVEKIEIEIQHLFPKAQIKRVYSKVLQNHTDYEKFYHDFKQHKFDIAIGTQILAKGLDIPGVSLVGIISADTGLHMPYFRASEKIFRLITQVSGRSGRRGQPGQTIIQTYWPESAAIRFASKHDFEGFYNAEIEKRSKKNYPPKTQIIRVLSENRVRNTARENMEKLAKELSFDGVDFIGPGSCFFQRLNNRFRYQIMIKIPKLPDKKITEIFHRHQNLVWDVDPLNLL
jgi:primosomal protein N' (replication factor Y)